MGRHNVTAAVFFVCCLTACGVRKTTGGATVERGAYHRHAAPAFSIELFGDYWFHPPKKKYFPELRNGFLPEVLAPTGKRKAELLFASHSVVLPYYSLIGILYREAGEKALLDAVRDGCKARFNARVGPPDTLTVTDRIVYRMSYTVLNTVTKRETRHRDYLFSDGRNVFRLLFWTTDSNTELFEGETDKLVKRIQL